MIRLPYYATSVAFLLACLSTLYYQFIELKELAYDCLSLYIQCVSTISIRSIAITLCRLSFAFQATSSAMVITSHIHLSTSRPQHVVGRSHLQNLQLPQAILYQLLHPPAICFRRMLPKRIFRPPLSVLSEIVCGELSCLAKE